MSNFLRCNALLLFLLPPFVAAQGDPLFLSDDPLEITIEMPLAKLLNDLETEVLGVVRLRGTDGETVAIEMTMTTRGRSRRKYCSFPPLKVNLKKGQTRGTVLEGQNELKIVTHCKGNDTHERYLQQEFGIYKAYNELTGFSYRARWLTVTYVDTDGRRDSETRPAFFIESNKEMEKRLEREKVTLAKVPESSLDPVVGSQYALFQYLIANTDWSMLSGPDEEGCCHNGKILQVPGTSNGWVPVPYDFDQSGLIDTTYALPGPSLKLRSVRQRLYRGRCRHNAELGETVALFNEKRAALETHLAPDSIGDNLQKRALGYIDDFYKIVNDPRKLEKQVMGACIGS